MAYLCSSCSKFASVEAECDSVTTMIDSYDAETGTGVIAISAELRLVSQCCSSDVAMAQTEDTFSFELKHTKADCADLESDPIDEVALEDVTDWYDGVANPKTGKMPPARYQKHYWGVEGTVTVSCPGGCDASVEVEYRVGEAGSSFDEC